MQTFCCLIITVIILGVVGFMAYLKADENKTKRHNQIANNKRKYAENKRHFYEVLPTFFKNTYCSYKSAYSILKYNISEMEVADRELKSLSENCDDGSISICSKLANEFDALGQRVNSLPFTRMMDADHYGIIQKAYMVSVRSMNKATADTLITNCERSLASPDYSQIFAIDIEEVLRCIWFYATDKPYSAESFKRAVNVFSFIAEYPHIDVTIAELYTLKQVGGEDALLNRISDIVRSLHTVPKPKPDYGVHTLLNTLQHEPKTTYTAEELTLIASALMWMNAYQAENMILQNMLTAGMQMPAKTQERLHSLTNGGGKAPDGFNAVSNSNALYFDVSALTWKDDEYTGLFENLAFQEKTLSYSLAVTDEDKELFITNNINVPSTEKILTKLNSLFADEYGTAVTAELKDCIALSGSGEENVEGILVESNECKQMGVLVHVVRIGKKLNIKFYTLFMPGETKLADQKQQALSLYKKLSPSVTMWEKSLKDTVLMAIQQLLNEEPSTLPEGGGNSAKDTIVF